MTVGLLVVAALVTVGLVAAVVVALTVSGRRRRVELPGGPNAEVLERLARMEGELDGRLKSLDGRVQAVTSMFGSAQGRGGWGELSLRQALDHAGLVEGRDFALNRSTGADAGRPDAVVNLPGGRRLVIDAKFPVARFTEACAADDATLRTRLMAEHGQALLKMAKELNRRGYHTAAAGGHVVMYLPDEGLYVEAMRSRPTLFDEVRQEGVLLAGPATLLALLGVTAQVIGEHRALEEARRIVDDTRELQVRLAAFTRHLVEVGRKLGTTVDGYNKAVGSWETRLMPQVNKLVSHAPGGATALEPTPVDTAVRELAGEGDPRLTVVG